MSCLAFAQWLPPIGVLLGGSGQRRALPQRPGRLPMLLRSPDARDAAREFRACTVHPSFPHHGEAA